MALGQPRKAQPATDPNPDPVDTNPAPADDAPGKLETDAEMAAAIAALEAAGAEQKANAAALDPAAAQAAEGKVCVMSPTHFLLEPYLMVRFEPGKPVELEKMTNWVQCQIDAGLMVQVA